VLSNVESNYELSNLGTFADEGFFSGVTRRPMRHFCPSVAPDETDKDLNGSHSIPCFIRVSVALLRGEGRRETCTKYSRLLFVSVHGIPSVDTN
jgi:hypothetical protein